MEIRVQRRANGLVSGTRPIEHQTHSDYNAANHGLPKGRDVLIKRRARTLLFPTQHPRTSTYVTYPVRPGCEAIDPLWWRRRVRVPSSPRPLLLDLL